MRYGLFFFGVLLWGIAFEFAQQYDDRLGRVNLFLLSEREIYPSSYVYYSGQHIVQIALGVFAMSLMAKIISIAPFKHYALLFIVLESIDFVDFWITNNDLWFEFRGWPITYNVIKFLVFTLVIIYDYALDFLTSEPTRDGS